MSFALEQVDHVRVNRLELLIGDILVAKVWVGLIRLVHHGLELELVLDVGALLLELVVVILEDLDELLEVLNALLVVQFDSLERNTVVVRHVSHTTQLAVFCRHIVDDVGEVVDLAHKCSDLLLTDLLLLAQQVDLVDRLLNVLAASVEGQVLIQLVNFISELCFFLAEGLVLFLHSLKFELEGVSFSSKLHHFAPLIFHGNVHFLAHDLLNSVDVSAGIVQFLSILVSQLKAKLKQRL